MGNVCFPISVLITVFLLSVKNEKLEIRINYIGTAHIHYNDSCGLSYTISGVPNTFTKITLHGQMNKVISPTRIGTIIAEFQESSNNEETWVYHNPAFRMKIRDTLHYWFYAEDCLLTRFFLVNRKLILTDNNTLTNKDWP